MDESNQPLLPVAAPGPEEKAGVHPPQRDRYILKVSRVPDWGRRAIRLGLALVVFVRWGQRLWGLPPELRDEWGAELQHSLSWGAASCVVVAASPLIGKVTQLSFERTLGTVVGGILAYVVYDWGVLLLAPSVGEWLVAFSAAVMAVLSCYLSYIFELHASMQLFVITFLLVVNDADAQRGALGAAVLTTAGVAAGVAFMMLLTVVLLPKSATVESLRETKSALRALEGLAALVLDSIRVNVDAVEAAAGVDGLAVSRTSSELLEANSDTAQGWAKTDEKCEAALSSVYKSMFKVKDDLELSEAEIYVWHFWGHYIFVPALWAGPSHLTKLLHRWRLPKVEMEALATSIRRIARLLYTLHLSFSTGFDASLLHHLREAYPAGLIGDFATSLTGVLSDVAVAFPNRSAISTHSLKLFGDVVEAMLDLSDSHRREVLDALARMGGVGWGTPTSVQARTQHGHSILSNSMSLSKHPGAWGATAAVDTPHAAAEGADGPMLHRSIPAAPASTSSVVQPDFFSRVTTAMLSAASRDPSVASSGSLSLSQERRSSCLSVALQRDDSEQRAVNEPRSSPQAATADGAGGGPAALEMPAGTVEATEWARGDLPTSAGPLSQQSWERTGGPEKLRAFAKSARMVTLLFPPTVEGHVSQIRWYSFQFLVDSLADELENLCVAATAVLSRLPYGV